MENKQTAVEWLIEQKKNHKLGLITKVDLKQALQMEKEQIMEAYMSATLEYVDDMGIDLMKRQIISKTDNYYNETYGNG